MTRFMALLTSMALAVPSMAEPSRSAEWIDERVAALSSPVFAVRESATRDLLLVGEPALERLREASESKSLEQRRRAAELARQIAWHVENQRLLSTAPNLRLRFDGTSMSAAVAEFKRRTGLDINLDPRKAGDLNRPITLDTGEVPFWDAVEQFYAKAGLVESVTFSGSEQFAAPVTMIQGGNVVTSYRIQSRPTNMAFTLVAGSDADAGTCVTDGPIRIRALPRNDAAAEALSRTPGASALTLEVTPVPSLEAQEVIGVRLRKIVDEEGRLLVQSHVGTPSADGTQAYGDFGFAGGVVMMESSSVVPMVGNANPRHVAVGIRSEDSKPRMLSLVEGHVSVRIQTGPEEVISVRDPIKAIGRSFDAENAELTILDLSKSGTGYTLRLRTRQEFGNNTAFNAVVQMRAARMNLNGKPVAAAQMTIGSNLDLRDADDKPMKRQNVSLRSQQHNGGLNGIEIIQEFEVNFTGGSGEPSRLVMTGMKPFTMRIPFVLKNVPLP